MICIIGAMRIEIENLKKLMLDIKCEDFSHMKFFSGKINNVECLLALCGPGKVNAAICTQLIITKYKPIAIINIGVAGALEPYIKIGDLVLASSVVQHDMDTSTVGDKLGFISGLNIINIPCSNYINEKIQSAASQLNEKLYSGVIATGDQFISNNKQLSFIKNTFNAIACEMEAGSIGHVCFVNNVNFAAIRVISDNANQKSHIDYEKFKIIAVEKITNIVLKTLPYF